METIAEQELDRRYVDGYRASPEDATAARLNARLLAKILPPEKW